MSRWTGEYPSDWNEIARRVKEEACWTCIRCGHKHDPKNGYCLTVHHASGNKSDCRWWNLLALCQRCHLRIQGRVILDRPWLYEHSDWFRPYVAGFYAHKYLGEELTREAVAARLDDLLALERNALIGAASISSGPYFTARGLTAAGRPYTILAGTGLPYRAKGEPFPDYDEWPGMPNTLITEGSGGE